ncbi:uncharacterized protein YydD (DUF2326 family) [Caulobacter ginsengisoli]|uniref:Uncharacterized protein YydD (DUF2326 family) n=1 Tax=Caulobacter ginsengisoli TaxID=400775 RepID=A0ABU0IY97_9CAUL|nr:ABC-three component system protein [Caulobacter ginsengisoli]MDQ0466335.1 uncharacterized protein YydD (DUF2326 family) [Caulobacter ginsengisoli]
MILTIESSIDSFKTVHFREGLNVVLAETSPQSTNKQTRNSAGKTSIIEIIHFLLGADCKPDSLFRTKALIDQSFTGSFRVDGRLIKVRRSGAAPSQIFILEGGEDRLGLTLKVDREFGLPCTSNTNWKTYLGFAMFDLPSDVKGTEFDESFTPSFRSMISYFARRGPGAILHCERTAEQQQRWDWQVNVSYMLGLDWHIPFDLNKVRAREGMLDELRKAAKGGALGDVVGTVAELRPQLIVAQRKAQSLRDQLASFEVLDSYRDLSRRAARAKTEIQAINREIVSRYETLNHLLEALAGETPPAQSDLERLYAAVGIELPGVALRRFEEVQRFHASVVSNRKAHLQQEIDETSRALASADSRLAAFSAERSEILRTLEGKGALEDFLTLQRQLAELEAIAASLGERFKAAELLEGESTQLKLDRTNIKLRLQADHHARKDLLDEAVVHVAETISDLYDDRTGGLVVEATENGPEFRIHIEGDRGGGISNMEVYCFDLMLFGLVTKHLGGPGFLIHDSHLFDGVDERQIAAAFELGQRATAGLGLQYIVTMNSDVFDRLPLPDDVEREKVVLPTRLSDQTETGGLFGFRFD